MLYNALRVHRNVSRVPLYIPKSLGGYGIVNIFHLQGIEKIKFYIMHLRLGDTTGKLLEISTRSTQMELGTLKSFWNLNYATHCEYTTSTWTTNIWDYLCQCGVKLIDYKHWVYLPPRHNDFHIMDVVYNRASDVYDDNNKRFKRRVYECEASLLSSLGWPRIKNFPPSWKKIWQSILTSIILPRIKANPLGKWIRPSHLAASPIIVEEEMCEAIEYKKLPQPTVHDFNVTSPKFARLVQRIREKI